MKYFLKKILFAIFLLIAILFLIAVVFPYNPDSYNRELFVKREMLQRRDSTGLILVGGSNVAFGFDSKRLSDSLQMPVYNFGLHAGLGLKFILDDVSRYLKSGDIVLVTPEYSHFHGDTAYGSQPLCDVTMLDLASLNLLNRPQFKAIFRNFLPFLRSKIEYTLVSWFYPSYQTIYRMSAFNRMGDVVDHWDTGRRHYTQLSVADNYDPNMKYLEEFKMQINRIRNQSVRLYVLPPVISSTSFENQRVFICGLQKSLDSLQVGFSDRIEKYALNDSLFYDTPYHCTHNGAIVHNQRISDFIENL